MWAQAGIGAGQGESPIKLPIRVGLRRDRMENDDKIHQKKQDREKQDHSFFIPFTSLKHKVIMTKKGMSSRKRNIGFFLATFWLATFSSAEDFSVSPTFREEMTFQKPGLSGFQKIGAFDVDDDGWLSLLDEAVNRIYVFDSQGHLTRQIAGPNESEPFGTTSGVAMTANGEIAVSDYDKFAVLYFSKEGRFLRQLIRKDLCIYSLAILKDGRIAARTSPLDGGPFRIEALILDPRLETVAVIGSVLSPQQGNTYDPFWVAPMWKAGPNELLYYSHPVDYEIEIFNSDGLRVGEIKKAVPPVRISDEGKKKASEAFIPSGYRFKFSEYRSAFQGFTVDDEGRVFVRTWDKSPEPGGFMYDLFDAQGRQIGRFPLYQRPAIWKKGKMYSIEVTEAGAQAIRRSDVRWDNDQDKQQIECLHK